MSFISTGEAHMHLCKTGIDTGTFIVEVLLFGQAVFDAAASPGAWLGASYIFLINEFAVLGV